jgi:hypothetical protein
VQVKAKDEDLPYNPEVQRHLNNNKSQSMLRWEVLRLLRPGGRLRRIDRKRATEGDGLSIPI